MMLLLKIFEIKNCWAFTKLFLKNKRDSGKNFTKDRMTHRDNLETLNRILNNPSLFNELFANTDHGYLLKLRRLGRSINKTIMSFDSYWMARIDAKLSAGTAIPKPPPAPAPVSSGGAQKKQSKKQKPSPSPSAKKRSAVPGIEHEDDEEDGAFSSAGSSNTGTETSSQNQPSSLMDPLQDQKMRKTTFQIINLLLKNENLWPDIRCVPPFRVFWALMSLYNLQNVHTQLEMQCATVEKKRAWRNEEERFFSTAHFFNQSLVDLEKTVFYYVSPQTTVETMQIAKKTTTTTTTGADYRVPLIFFTRHLGDEYMLLHACGTTVFSEYTRLVQEKQYHAVLLDPVTKNLLCFHLVLQEEYLSDREREFLHSFGTLEDFVASLRCYVRLRNSSIPQFLENLLLENCSNSANLHRANNHGAVGEGVCLEKGKQQQLQDDEEKRAPNDTTGNGGVNRESFIKTAPAPFPYNCVATSSKTKHAITLNRLKKKVSIARATENDYLPTEGASFTFLARPCAAANIRIGEVFLDPDWICVEEWLRTLSVLLHRTVFNECTTECVFPLREDQLFLVGKMSFSFFTKHADFSRNDANNNKKDNLPTVTVSPLPQVELVDAFGLDGARKKLFRLLQNSEQETQDTVKTKTALSSSSTLVVKHIGNANKTEWGIPLMHWSQQARSTITSLCAQMQMDVAKLNKKWEENKSSVTATTSSSSLSSPWQKAQVIERVERDWKSLQQEITEKFRDINVILSEFELGSLSGTSTSELELAISSFSSL
jgi:hypothetical protein